MQVVRAFFS